jgi:hypothetical protein
MATIIGIIFFVGTAVFLSEYTRIQNENNRLERENNKLRNSFYK